MKIKVKRAPGSAAKPAKAAGRAGKKRRKAATGTRRGALVLLSALLVASALIRIGIEAGPALAEATSSSHAADQGASEHGAAGSDNGDGHGDARTADDLAPMIQALQAREHALDSRERQIEDRMKALAIAERSVREKIAAMQEAEARLNSSLAMAEAGAEDDVARLTSVYERMKPKQSAELFSQMDPEFAAGFLARMKPEAAASILAGMEPQTAYTISVVLAGRNARAPAQ
ncbi:MotE family protein [Chachezhania sediminis]|uniref:MotE family protein n=1 Tax=Chachezhania sediminis TaxID=2599291 RepID=UPI00131C29FE|nr:hypothetical protein [Chachezhania sediminis]